MKKLYNVNINTDIVVYASDEKEAKNIAVKNIKKELKNTIHEYSNNEFKINIIRSDEELPKSWYPSCLPWGLKEDKNIGQILDEIKY